MKKSLRCICAAIFALAFCTGFVIHASAVERASSYLTRYSATLFAGDRGAVEITISVVANQRVSELGASYILLVSPTMAEGPGAPPKSTRAKAG